MPTAPAPYVNVQGSSAISGGNDPVRAAAASNLRGGMTAATPPMQAPMGAPPPAGMQQGAGNPLATTLAQAFQILLQTGPTPENLSALEGFFQSVMQLNPAGSAPQAPLGQVPGNTPLPPAPPAQGIAGMNSPMVPPRQA